MDFHKSRPINMEIAFIATVRSAMLSTTTWQALCYLVTGMLCSLTSAQSDDHYIPDMVAYTGKLFSVTFVFHPVYGKSNVNIQMSASTASCDDHLPRWLLFNSTDKSLIGVPSLQDQGSALLTIDAKCNQQQQSADHINSQCHESSYVFQLNISKSPWVNILSSPVFELSSKTNHLKEVNIMTEPTSEDYDCDGDRVVASLILCASLEETDPKERVDLMTVFSDFLSIPVASISLEASMAHSLRALENGFQMVSAGPGLNDACNLDQNTEILWWLSCSTIKHLNDFIRVLQHNVDGGRLQKEIGKSVVGWYVASSNSLLTRQNRRRRGAGQRTIVPTPSLQPFKPTHSAAAGLVDVASTSVYQRSQMHTSVTHSVYFVKPESLTPDLSSFMVPTIPTQTSQPFTSAKTVIITSQSVSSTFSQIIQPSSSQVLSPIFHDSPIHGLVSPALVEPSLILLSEDSPKLITMVPKLLTDHVHSMPQSSQTSKLMPTTMIPSPTPATPAFSSPLIFSFSHSIMAPSSDVQLSRIYQTPLSEDIHTISPSFTSQFPELIPTEAIEVSLTEQQDYLSSQLSPAISPSLTLFPMPWVTSRDVEVLTSLSSYETEIVSVSRTSLLPRTTLISSAASTLNYTRKSMDISEYPKVTMMAQPSIEIGDILQSSSDLLSSSSLQYSSRSSAELHLIESHLYNNVTEVSKDLGININFSTSPSTEDEGFTQTVDTHHEQSSVKAETVTFPSQIPTTFPSYISHFSNETFSYVSETTDLSRSSYSEKSSTVTAPSIAHTKPTVGSSLLTKKTTKAAPTTSQTYSVSYTTRTATAAVPRRVSSGRLATTPMWIPPWDVGNEEDEDEEGSNNRPYVRKSISLIRAEQGRFLEFNIPHDVFYDFEDGDTSILELSLELPSNQIVPSNFWLYLEPVSRVIKGLPLHEDMDVKNFSVVLVARDSQGLEAKDTIVLQINDAPRSSFTHVFRMRFAIDFQKFMHNRRNIIDLLVKIGTFFGDPGAEFMTVLEVRQGSFVLHWTNNTLTGGTCRRDIIMQLLGQMIRRDGTVRPAFIRHVGRHLQLKEVLVEPRGKCISPPSTTPSTMTTEIAPVIKGHGFSIWTHVILPVVIAFLVFILIILIIIFCNRRRRQQETPQNTEKEAVSIDHNPVVSPNDTENDGPPFKARDSHSVISDSQPSGIVTTSSVQPKNNLNRDQERARKGRDNREQEWINRDEQIAGLDHGRDWGRNWNRKQAKDGGGKRQRDHNRMSGVSASSTLSWDRPNNHYLEEEAGSRSSTLKSTKSSGSDKRRPKSPPPYWHHSDPPPYRLPPPYLTNNSTQI